MATDLSAFQLGLFGDVDALAHLTQRVLLALLQLGQRRAQTADGGHQLRFFPVPIMKK